MEINDNMTKNTQKFETILESYVYLRECCAVRTERIELDLDDDVYDLKDYCDDLLKIADKHQIKHFKIADNTDDYDVLNEYTIYMENKLDSELKYRLTFMYKYD